MSPDIRRHGGHQTYSIPCHFVHDPLMQLADMVSRSPGYGRGPQPYRDFSIFGMSLRVYPTVWVAVLMRDDEASLGTLLHLWYNNTRNGHSQALIKAF